MSLPAVQVLDRPSLLADLNDRFRAVDQQDGEFDLVPVTHRVEHKAVLHPEIAVDAARRKPNCDAVVSFVDARDDAPERLADGRGRVGFVDSVTRPFCGDCSRLRLTSDGRVRVCLYDDREVDVREALRSGAGDADLLNLVRGALAAKGRGGALDLLQTRKAPVLVRTMHQIGG